MMLEQEDKVKKNHSNLVLKENNSGRKESTSQTLISHETDVDIV